MRSGWDRARAAGRAAVRATGCVAAHAAAVAATAVVAVGVALGVAGCASGDDGPPPTVQTGAQLYESQNCALCHGEDGTSSWWRPGTDLTAHLDTWTVETLAEYIRDPDWAAVTIDRLTTGNMAGFPHLDEASRRRLAEYVLTLGDGRAPDG